MTETLERRRFWKRGDHTHVWIVDAVVVPRRDDRGPYAILVSEHGTAEEEVELDRLHDRRLYTPVPDDPHRVEGGDG